MGDSLTVADIRRAVEALKKVERPMPPMVICHPGQAWYWALMYGHGRWEAFKQFWNYKHLMNDDQIMEALAGIIAWSIDA